MMWAGQDTVGRTVRIVGIDMKAVVAVDLMSAFVPALHLYKNLGFESPEASFINVVEPVLPDASFPELAASQPLTQILEELKAAGQEALERAVQEFPGAAKRVVLGHAAASIMELAESEGADLVVVGSQQKSLIESFFSGSVTRALTTHCKCSVLVGKTGSQASPGLTVVVTHDLSEYSQRAIHRFVEMAPRGIDRIVLLTADTTDPSIIAVVERIDPKMAGETHDAIENSIAQQLLTVKADLDSVCRNVELVVSEGSANKVIEQTMTSVNADLLVMGAHGHGFFEKLFIGSVALHQVVRTPHNVLLMRA